MEIKASDFFTEVKNEFIDDYLANHIIKALESQLTRKLNDIRTSNTFRKQFIDNVQNKEERNIAMIYAGNEYTIKKVREIFEPRGFIVKLSRASGTTLQIPIK